MGISEGVASQVAHGVLQVGVGAGARERAAMQSLGKPDVYKLTCAVGRRTLPPYVSQVHTTFRAARRRVNPSGEKFKCLHLSPTCDRVKPGSERLAVP